MTERRASLADAEAAGRRTADQLARQAFSDRDARRMLALALRKRHDEERAARDAVILVIRAELLPDLSDAAAAKEIADAARGAHGGNALARANRKAIRARLEQLGDSARFPGAARIRQVLAMKGDSLGIESQGD